MAAKRNSSVVCLPSDETVWAFDLGKGSVGEAIRRGNSFIHREALLIPEEFAETQSAANRRRMFRTREAHKARERWLKTVCREAGIEVLAGRTIRRNTASESWQVFPADPRLEREFAAEGDRTCYTSCLLRIRLLRGEKLAGWQVYKALHSAIQRRGYDPDLPWKARGRREESEGDAVVTMGKMAEYQKSLQRLAPNDSDYAYPCYHDAWRMGLWDPDRPDKLLVKQSCHAESTRNCIVPRKSIEKELRALVEAAARQFSKLKGKADYVLYGPAGRPYASYFPETRQKYGLRPGADTDWQGVLSQKVPRFDNRIIEKCVLIPRLNVCKIRKGDDGRIHPKSLLVAEVVFLMKLKNAQVLGRDGIRKLSARELIAIFNNPQRKKFGFTATQWQKQCETMGVRPVPGHEEFAEPAMSGRSRFCRPALGLLKALILSGQSPQDFHANALKELSGNKDPRKGLVAQDLAFLLRMGETWDKIYVPNQKLEALVELSTEPPDEKIRALIGQQKDPIVRHRLGVFAERLNRLAHKFGPPGQVVLEFVREDFMGDKARLELMKFQRERAKERARAREDAAKVGAHSGGAGLRMELFRMQGGICLYTGEPLAETSIEDYHLDHIVPQAKGGPDSILNYALTTDKTNALKGDRTPYEWLSNQPGWDAYLERIRSKLSVLRHKKVQLLTSPDATTFAERYTALAETAWIAKLAQTIVSLKFGWKMGVHDGRRKVTVVSGGLTGRIRRRFKLNSLLSPDAENEEAAEQKNRDDKRHHALDAMVISFIPGCMRNPQSDAWFSFPKGVDRDLFKREIDKVVPKCICLEKARLEETFYGRRHVDGKEFAVGREKLSELAVKLVSGKRALKNLSDIETHRIVDHRIRTDVEKFLSTNARLSLLDWDAWGHSYTLGPNGPKVVKCMMTKSKADVLDEYKDVSKDGTGQLKKGARHKGYFVYERPAPTKSNPARKQVEVLPVYAHESIAGVRKRVLECEAAYFESNCLVCLPRAFVFRGKEYPEGHYTCLSVWADRRAKLRHPKYGEIGPISLQTLMDAGLIRVGI